MPNKYDVIVVGMGPSSIFCAYELIKLNKFKKVLLIDQGKRVRKDIAQLKKQKNVFTVNQCVT